MTDENRRADEAVSETHELDPRKVKEELGPFASLVSTGLGIKTHLHLEQPSQADLKENVRKQGLREYMETEYGELKGEKWLTDGPVDNSINVLYAIESNEGPRYIALGIRDGSPVELAAMVGSYDSPDEFVFEASKTLLH